MYKEEQEVLYKMPMDKLFCGIKGKKVDIKDKNFYRDTVKDLKKDKKKFFNNAGIK